MWGNRKIKISQIINIINSKQTINKCQRIDNENNIWGLSSKIRYLISLKIIHAVARHLWCT